MDVLVSGKSSFKIEVPYRLIETGPKAKKPLFVYLHGFNQNSEYFQNRFLSFIKKHPGYHLFIQGPYPAQTTKKKDRDWGYAWYLYDGGQGSFVKNLEYSAQFVQEVIDNIISLIEINRICIIGYSMGGYLAGYFGLSRWKHTNELIVIGARIKTEVFESRMENLGSQHILALHGADDDQVSPDAQMESIQTLVDEGVDAEYIEVPGGHKISDTYFVKMSEWLQKQGYQISAQK